MDTSECRQQTRVTLKIGILALQGAFHEHRQCLCKAVELLEKNMVLKNCKVELTVQEVRQVTDLQAGLHGLIIPGGESTTMGILLQRTGLFEPVKQWIQDKSQCGHVTWGTCAGLILLADEVEAMKENGQAKFGGLPIVVSRNAYGCQRESFLSQVNITDEKLKDCLGKDGVATSPGIFIRAPGIVNVLDPSINILATVTVQDGERIVAVEWNTLMATTFHPELSEDLRWHAHFLAKIIKSLTQLRVK